MAKLNFFLSQDMTKYNFYVVTANYRDSATEKNYSFNGYNYADVLGVSWNYGGTPYFSLFGGYGIQYYTDSYGYRHIGGGTATGYAELYYTGTTWDAIGYVQDISISAAELYNAFLSPSTADDYAVIQKYLSGNDTINGSNYNDTLVGYSGRDTINGNAGIDYIYGGTDNDFLSGGLGNDYLYGDNGQDTAFQSGSISQYVVTQSSSTIKVSDKLLGRDGTDTLTSIERIEFSDVTLCFDISHSDNSELVYRIYQAAFARMPDEAGYRYWEGLSNTLTPLEYATAFRTSPEFAQKYGANVTNNNYTETLYRNVLQREPDAGGLSYWQGVLNSGGMDRDQLLIEFAACKENVELTAPHIDNGYWLV